MCSPTELDMAAFYVMHFTLQIMIIAWFVGSLGWIALQRLFLIRARRPSSADLVHTILV